MGDPESVACDPPVGSVPVEFELVGSVAGGSDDAVPPLEPAPVVVVDPAGVVVADPEAGVVD